MQSSVFHLLLADDDIDDCMLFADALKELSFETLLETVSDGEELMNLLAHPSSKLPDVLFLDLNMPRKTGYECLVDIKNSERLRQIPVIIFSTSLNHEIIDLLFEHGAQHYIRKPGNFSRLKEVIFEALRITASNPTKARSKNNFILQV